MADIFSKVAEDMNADPLDSMTMEEIYNQYPDEEEKPKEEPPQPFEVKDTPQELVNKAATPESKSFLEKIFANADPNFGSSIMPNAAQGDTKAVVDIGKGVALGVTGIAQNISQLVYDIADGADNISKDMGLTEDEMLEPYRIDWKSKLGVPEDDIAPRIIGSTIEYLAPGFAAAKAFKLGKYSAAGINVALDALAMDPNQERLADLVTDVLPGLRDYGALGKALVYLEHNDKDGNWENRFKNGLESFFLNSTVIATPAVFNAIKGGINKTLSYLKKAPVNTSVKQIGTSLADTIQAQNTTKEIEKVIILGPGKGADRNLPARRVTAEIVSNEVAQVDELGNAIVKSDFVAGAKQAAKSSLFRSQILNPERNHYPIFVENATKTVDDVLPRTTHQEVITKGQAIVADPEKFDMLLAKDPSIEPYLPEEIYALKSEKIAAIDEIIEVAGMASELTDSELFELYNAFHVGVSAEVAERASARMAGQALEAEKIIGDIPFSVYKEQLINRERSLLVENAFSKMDEQTKIAFKEESLRLTGGRQAIIDAIGDIPHITPDEVLRRRWLEKARLETTPQKIYRAVSYGMQGAMLGFKTVYKTVVANPISVGINLVDLNVAVTMRQVQNSDVYRSFNGLPPLDNWAKNSQIIKRNMINEAFGKAILQSFGALGSKLYSIALELPAKAIIGTVTRDEEIYTTALNKFKGKNYGQYTKAKTEFQGLNRSVREQMNITDEDSLYLRNFGQLMGSIGMRGAAFKLLGEADNFFGAISYAVNKVSLAHDEISASLIPGQKLSMEDYTKFLESKVSNPSVELHKAAMNEAEHLMMAGDFPEKTNNPYFRMLRVIKDSKGLNLLLPFPRVAYNAAKFTIEHSPLGMFQFGGNLFEMAQVFRTGSQVQKDAAMSKIIVGSTIGGVLATLSSLGYTTGAASPNYRYAEALKDSGKEPLANSVFGISVDGIETIKPFVQLGSILAHAHTYLETEKFEGLMVEVGAALLSFFTSNQLLENMADISDLVDAASNGDITVATSARKFVTHFAGRFAPVMVKESSQAYNDYQNGDYYKRKLTSMGEGLGHLDRFIEDLTLHYGQLIPPVAADAPIDRNIFGEPQLLPSGIGFDAFVGLQENRAQESEVMERLRFLSHISKENPSWDIDRTVLGIEKPRNIVSIPKDLGGVTGVSVELNPKQYEKYLSYFGNKHDKAVGPTLRKQMEDAIGGDSPLFKKLLEAQNNPKVAEALYKSVIKLVRAPLRAAKTRAQIMIMQDEEFRNTYNNKAKVFMLGSDDATGAPIQPKMLGQ